MKCSKCSSLWRFAQSNYCKTLRNENASNAYSVATMARNTYSNGLLEPSERLLQFAEWVIEEFIHILSLSFIRLSSVEIMIKAVYKAYIADKGEQK